MFINSWANWIAPASWAPSVGDNAPSSSSKLHRKTVPFGIPKFLWDTALAAELGCRAVDCHSAHDGHNSILLLASVHVEQYLKRCSHFTLIFCLQNYCKESLSDIRKSCCSVETKTGIVKIGLSFRVMIWQPFAFHIPPFLANPSKTAFHPLARKLLILKLTSSFFFFMKIRTTLRGHWKSPPFEEATLIIH